MHGHRETIEKTKSLKEFASKIDLLIVEDDEMLLNQIYNLLSKFFRRVDLSSNGLEALNRVSERKYDLVITDLTMPIMDGVALIENIREHDSEQVIFVLSAHSESEKLLKLIELGIDGFLPKPVNMDIILLKLFNICKKISNKKELQENESTCDTILSDIVMPQKEAKSAIEFAKLYPYEITYVNQALEVLYYRANEFFIQLETNRNHYAIDTIAEILKEYVRHLANFREFESLVGDLESMIADCQAIRMSIEIIMPSLILLFENLEQFRRAVLESKSTQNIYEYERKFTKIFEQIKKDRNETFEIIKGILS